MEIEPYAFRENENRIRSDRISRLEELIELDIRKYITQTSTVSYAQRSFRGTIDKSCPVDLSLLDVAILLDGSPACPFGGTGHYDPVSGQFSITIYTD